MPEKSPLVLELIATLYTPEQLGRIVGSHPQIALAGRSNVGKSSLINALANRKNLAKVSSEPGKTRSVNLFRVLPDGFCLTDLPGYGYARQSKEERRSWAVLLENYLENTPSLKALALLIDCRIPQQESDRSMAEYARAKGIPLIGVLTKTDKCIKREIALQQTAWEKILGEKPLPVSAAKRSGLDSLWERLRKAVGFDRPREEPSYA